MTRTEAATWRHKALLIGELPPQDGGNSQPSDRHGQACRDFEQLAHLHERSVFNVCYRILGDAYAAEDATQETFAAAWSHWYDIREPGIAWLLTVANNKCRDELRWRSRHPSCCLTTVSDGPDCPVAREPTPETAMLAGNLQAELQDALDRLVWEQRLALILCDVEGYSYRRIAEVTRVSAGTVKSRIFRARRRLRRLLSRRVVGEA